MISQLMRRLLRLTPIFVVGNLTFLIASVLASRVLSPDDFALYSAQLGFIAVVATGVSGLQLDLAHAAAGGDSGPAQPESKLGLVRFGLLLTVGITVTLPLLMRLWDVKYTGVAALVLVPLFVLTTAAINGVLHGSRRFGLWFSVSAVLGVWRVAVLLLAFIAVLSVELIVTLLILGGSAIASIYFREKDLRVFVMNWRVSRRFITLSISSVALWAMVYADLMLIRRFVDADLAGALAALLTMVKGALIIPILIGQLVFPELADPRNPSGINDRDVRRLTLLVGLIGLVGTLILGIAGTWLLEVVYGMSAIPSADVIWTVSCSIVPLALLIIIGNLAMSAVSSVFAAGIAVVAAIYYLIGATVMQTVEQLLLLASILPMLTGMIFFAFQGKIVRWPYREGASERS